MCNNHKGNKDKIYKEELNINPVEPSTTSGTIIRKSPSSPIPNSPKEDRSIKDNKFEYEDEYSSKAK